MSQSHRSALEAAPAIGPRPRVILPTLSSAGREVTEEVVRSRHGSPFRLRFWFCLALTAPVLVFSPDAQLFAAVDAPRFSGSRFLPAIFGFAVAVLGGAVFVRGALAELRDRRVGVMVLSSIAIAIGFTYSVAVSFGFDGRPFWWQLSALITILLLVNWMESSFVSGFRALRGELDRLLPGEASVVTDDGVVLVPTGQLRPGDLVFVTTGGIVPVDGEVIEGAPEVDESPVTGVGGVLLKAVGASVCAGSRLVSGTATVRVERSGETTGLAISARLVDDLQSSTSRPQTGAERAASLLGWLTLGVALVAAAVWFVLVPGDPAFAVERLLAVLVVASPPAVRLAIPLVVWMSTSVTVRRGVLIRTRRALDEARNTQVVLFDKTGTLTGATLTVEDVITTGTLTENELLALASAVERKSSHPIGRAIAAEATARKLRRGRPSRHAAITGRGATAMIDKREVTVASARVAIERGIIIDGSLVRAAHEAGVAGRTVVYVLTENEVLGMICLAGAVRPEAEAAVMALASQGIRAAIVSGDTREAARYVGDQLGIAEVFAEVLPEEESHVVQQLQHDGTVVATVGDPESDAAALEQADIAMAVAPGPGVATTADVVLPTSDPRGAAEAVELSRAVHRKTTQNLSWAAVYNVIAIALAAGLASVVGVSLAPALAAALPVAAVAFIALNSRWLKNAVVAGRGSTRP